MDEIHLLDGEGKANMRQINKRKHLDSAEVEKNFPVKEAGTKPAIGWLRLMFRHGFRVSAFTV